MGATLQSCCTCAAVRAADSVLKFASSQSLEQEPWLTWKTIKKELDTLRTIWSWARSQEYVDKPFPKNELRFPKTTEKPHFQTHAEIERQIAKGDLTIQQQKDLWDALYLDSPQLRDLVQIIKSKSRYDFLYPMAVMAAYTGARRSELVRSIVSDFDFDQGIVIIHEKERVPGKHTTRRVPICDVLKNEMIDWFNRKREAQQLFRQSTEYHDQENAVIAIVLLPMKRMIT